jgi:hypothetical protein
MIRGPSAGRPGGAVHFLSAPTVGEAISQVHGSTSLQQKQEGYPMTGVVGNAGGLGGAVHWEEGAWTVCAGPALVAGASPEGNATGVQRGAACLVTLWWGLNITF